MTFSDTSGGQGLVQEVDFLVNTDSVTYPIADKTRNINRWLDVVVSDILRASNRWQWDDTNFTDLAKGKTNLVSGQEQYSFDSTWLTVERVDIKDQNGNWVKLHPIDQRDIAVAYDEFEKTDGTPRFFDVSGENLFLKPASDYDSALGLQVFFKRKPDYFSVGDTDKEAGFASTYHRILSLGASYDYALSRQLPQTAALRQELEAMRNELKIHYSSRNEYERPRITPRRSGDYV